MENEDKKKKKMTKKLTDFNDCDFSFLSLPQFVGCAAVKITDQHLQSSASYKILHDELVPHQCSINKSNKEDVSDLECLEQKLLSDKNIIFKFKQSREFRPLSIERSLLSKKEHEQCIRALEILTSGQKANAKQQNDIFIFKNLEKKRCAEYTKFSEYVKNEWMSKNNPRLLEIQSDLKKFINHYWTSKQNRIFDYPSNYRVMSMLPLENKMPGQPQTRIEVFTRDIEYKCGYSKLINLQRLDLPYKCINNFKSLVTETEKIVQKSNVSVSQDEVCIDISKKHDVNIVISSSGLKCLLDNHPPNYNREWIIPVVIKEFDIENDYKKRKVVFVDKPLPALRYSIHQQNQWANKISLKVNATLNKENTKKKNKKSASESEILESEDMLSFKSSEYSSDRNSAKRLKLDKTESDDLGNKIKHKNEKIVSKQLEFKNKKAVKSEKEINENRNNICLERRDDISLQINIKETESKYEDKNSKNNEITKSNLKMFKNENNVFDMLTFKMDCERNEKDDDSDSDNLQIDDTVDDCDSFLENSFDIDQSSKRITRSMTKTTPTNKNILNTSNKSPSIKNKSQTEQRLEVNTEDVMNKKTEEIENYNDNVAESKNITQGIIEKKSFNQKANRFSNYRVWKFCESYGNDTKLLQKKPEKELNILIRSKSHGKANINNQEKEILLTPKLEYQMEYGAECCSLSESTRQWCSLFFNPDTSLVRVRINPENSTVLMQEKLDLNGITNELSRIHKHDPKKDLNRVFRILNIMHSSLLPGTYILKHDTKMGEAAKLYMADSNCDSVQLNLHTLYDNITLDKVSLEQTTWNAIDPFIVTLKHKEACVLPSMFSWNFEEKSEKYLQHIRSKHKITARKVKTTKNNTFKRKRKRK